MPEQDGYYGGTGESAPMQQPYTPQTGAFPYGRRGYSQNSYINGGYYNQNEYNRYNQSAPEGNANPAANRSMQGMNISGNSPNSSAYAGSERHSPQNNFRNNMWGGRTNPLFGSRPPYAGNSPGEAPAAPEPPPVPEEKEKNDKKGSLLSLLDGIKIDPEKAALILLIIILARNDADITLIAALAYLLM